MSVLRGLAVPIGAVTAVLLFLLFNPWLVIDDPALRPILTVAFWVAFIVLLIALFEDRKNPDSEEVEIEGPAFTRFLFSNSRAGLFWLPIRLFVGFAWLEAGWHKFTDPEWTQGGAALRAYWERAASIPEQGRPPITYEWYRDFINTLLNANAEPWMAWVITLGELAIGHRADLRDPDRRRCLLRGVHEHVVPARGLGVDEPRHVHAGGRAHARLEGGRLLRRRPISAAASRNPMASRSALHPARGRSGSRVGGQNVPPRHGAG